MPKMRFTEFLALSVDQRVGISWSASETGLITFCAFDIKNYFLSFVISSSFDILYCTLKQSFPNIIQCFSGGAKVTSLLKARVLMF